jgi:hypothetical protein
MANIITSKFRSDSVSFFFNDLENNNYFLFGSSADRTTGVNSPVSTNDFLERTIFGKEITAEENFFYVIKNYPWQINQIYDQYDDTIDLSDKRYYAVVYPENNSTGDFRIYKCLSNNYGAPSLFPPTGNENNGDEYIWELMYILSETDFNKYNTLGYIPITANTLIANTSFATSTIDKIIVENNTENNGYEIVLANTSGNLGSVNIVGGNYDDIIIEAKAGFELSAFGNYYSGNTLYAYNTNTGSANVYTIDTYTYNSISRQAVITLVGSPPDDGIIQQGLTDIEILPTIEITGDGSGAIAIPEVVDGKITKVVMLERGSGYTKASARVINQFGFDPTATNSLDVVANLRIVLSPRGGHAANLVDELSCKHCLIYNEITEFDNNTFPTTNTFSKIGIVKNPEFTSNTTIFDNRIQVQVANTASFIVNDQVDQIDTNNQTIFSARVHEVSANTNILYLSEYHGPYQNQANTNFSIDSSIPLRNSQGNVVGINTITYPPYIPKSGSVYYMIDFFPIERTTDSRELFKIIIEF